MVQPVANDALFAMEPESLIAQFCGTEKQPRTGLLEIGTITNLLVMQLFGNCG
jgi:hypothetical protein